MSLDTLARVDPSVERRRSREPTFEQAAPTVHKDYDKAWRNAKHRAQWINT